MDMLGLLIDVSVSLWKAIKCGTYIDYAIFLKCRLWTASVSE